MSLANSTKNLRSTLANCKGLDDIERAQQVKINNFDRGEDIYGRIPKITQEADEPQKITSEKLSSSLPNLMTVDFNLKNVDGDTRLTLCER